MSEHEQLLPLGQELQPNAEQEVAEGVIGVSGFPGHGSGGDLFEPERRWWLRSIPENSGGVSGFPGHGINNNLKNSGVSGFPG